MSKIQREKVKTILYGRRDNTGEAPECKMDAGVH